jgi:hypothetical protein
VAIRRANPGWGPRTILSRLRRELQSRSLSSLGSYDHASLWAVLGTITLTLTQAQLAPGRNGPDDLTTPSPSADPTEEGPAAGDRAGAAPLGGATGFEVPALAADMERKPQRLGVDHGTGRLGLGEPAAAAGPVGPHRPERPGPDPRRIAPAGGDAQDRGGVRPDRPGRPVPAPVHSLRAPGAGDATPSW